MRRSGSTSDRGAGARSVALRLAMLAVVGSSLVLAGCSGGKPAAAGDVHHRPLDHHGPAHRAAGGRL